MVDVTLIRPLN